MGRVLKLKNVIYFPSFNLVGGVETYCYEMGLKYGKSYDITVLYKNGAQEQMERIAKVARVIRITSEDKIICDVFIFGCGWDILEQVEAKEYIQTFHADYINRKLNPSPSPKITKRFGVAENTTRGIREHFEWAKNLETMYNPYTPKKTKKVLKLISATRLTAEKGYGRMKALCDAFDAAGIPFIWLVFTDHPTEKPPVHPNMAILPAKVEGIYDYIASASYLVQLSDTEGFSYAITESLSLGVPVIATDFAVAREQGIVDGKTGWILPMDMSDIPVKKIYKGVPKFTWEPFESHYEKVFVKGKCEYVSEISKAEVRIRAVVPFFDIKESILRQQGDTWIVDVERGDSLKAKGLAEVVEFGY